MAQHEHDVTALEAIEAGQMRVVEIEGQSVLLVRDGEYVHALGANCPHAGGPLAEGVRCGDRLVCPWHKATFSLRTGAVLEPPAMDPLPRHQARIANGRVLVTLAEVTLREAASGDDRCFVIVGAGAAGAVAAQTLREAGFGGRVLMLDRDNRVPYDRTILSKYVLSGEKGGEKSPLQSQSFYRDQRIPITVTSSPRSRKLAATSMPMKLAPRITARALRSACARIASESARLRRTKMLPSPAPGMSARFGTPPVASRAAS